jgi:hypothetical protein
MLVQLPNFLTYLKRYELRNDVTTVRCYAVRIAEEAAVDAIVRLLTEGTYIGHFMNYLLFLRLVCFCSLVVNSYGLFRLLRLGGLLIGCGSTTHSRFAASCILSLSKFLFFY